MSNEYKINFKDFSKINKRRCETDFEHKLSDWSLSDWGVALAGETGEVCDVIKKLNRIRDGVDKANFGKTKKQLTADLAHEIGDVYAYLDLLAQAAGLDIYEDCIRKKFNVVSKRMGSGIIAPLWVPGK